MNNSIKALISKCINSSNDINIEAPKNDSFGDYSTNVAIQLSKKTFIKPIEASNALALKISEIDKCGLFSSVTGTPQGFINFKISDSKLHANLINILKNRSSYGEIKTGKGEKVLLEFVSANPTGPLHIGHGRWAVIGDCLARLLKAAGYKVNKEFYVNDAGEQVSKLAASVEASIKGGPVPEDGYAGSYIHDIAKMVKGSSNIKQASLKILLDDQKKTLNSLRVTFDKWFFESELHKKKKIHEALKELEKRSLIFHEGNAVWFRSSTYGDDKNRVLIKDDGSPTYFAADIAYHIDKFKRGYKRLINVWGTDHHGYVARLKGALLALGYPTEDFEIIIGQLVALYRGKELVRMSKRTGEMITLKEVMDEIGVDATRYFLVKTSPNTHLDFDLELAKSKSLENPVYYVSYAHARICSIIAEAQKNGLKVEPKANLSLLSSDIERKIMVKLLRLEDEIEIAAKTMQPHRLTAYAEELAKLFHNYYHQHRVVTEDKELSKARLALCSATSIVIKNVLKLLGITAPEHM
jgi:arginyl-tRNA synthetase